MATEKWVAGAVAFTACFGAEINSMANGSGVISSVALTNATNLDLFADVDFKGNAAITPLAPGFLNLYLLPLLHDGTTYGDGVTFPTTAAAITPGSTYLVDSLAVPVGSSITVAGMWRRLELPAGAFKFALWNQLGVALSSAPVVQYRTINRAVA